jgi:hypothetical protein
MFECWVVQHVQREFNVVADWVANQYIDYKLTSTGSKGTIDAGLRLSIESVNNWVQSEQCLSPWASVGPYDVPVEVDESMPGSHVDNELQEDGASGKVTEVQAVTAEEYEAPDMRARVRRIRIAQCKEPWMSELITYLESDEQGIPPQVKRDDAFNYVVIDTLLCKITTHGAYHNKASATRPLVVIPRSLRQILINETHAGLFESHGGIQETYDKLVSMVTWPGMFADVVRFVRTCSACQAAKHARHHSQPTRADSYWIWTHGCA